MRRFALLLLLTPSIVFAQATVCPSPLPVRMSLEPQLTSTVASASVGVYANLQNESTELQSGMLAIDIIQKTTGTSVDRFIVPDRITLLVGSSNKVGFIWTVPAGLPNGTYTIAATFIATSTKIADAYAGILEPSASADITVSGGTPQSTVSTVSSVTVNGMRYTPHHVTRITASAQVIAATLNGTDAPYEGTLTWQLYPARATIGDAPLDSKTDTVQLHPGTTVNATYTLSDTSAEGYYLRGKLTDDKSSSFFDVWLDRSGASFPELRCAETVAPLSSGNAKEVVAIILGIVILGGIVEYVRHRRA